MRIPRSLGYVLKIALVMCFYTFALWVLFRVLASVTKPKKNRVLVDGEEDYLFDESDAEDETLLEHVAGNYVDLLRISKILDRRNSTEDYSLRMPSDVDLSEHKQSSALLQLLNAKENGTFLEAGAFDGEFFSNSLYLERNYGWRGVLVEPITKFYNEILSKKRKAVLLNACLSPKPWFEYMNMTIVRSGIFRIESMSSLHGYNMGDFDPEKHDQETVECYPIFDVLSAAKLTQLDVLMLDVQGAEEDILRTIPWRLVDIRVILVEISKFGKDHLPRKLFHQEQRLKAFLGKQGYDVKAVLGRDFIFVRE
ncbi:unnamed protein product [Notodromas monacha]|uniref:Methyltransferase FkbM domain-containing protein n=1 Tax=Notodromas monacha TaxID=399045 RepID=A0A7R9GKJ3_9CRUS|nr:unnamed protein product [Notodromas monacha]CAG0924671.1 unnamed protein product [Notodromas monacha]